MHHKIMDQQELDVLSLGGRKSLVEDFYHHCLPFRPAWKTAPLEWPLFSVRSWSWMIAMVHHLLVMMDIGTSVLMLAENCSFLTSMVKLVLLPRVEV